MKRAVSISLGSPSRDKKVVVTLGGQSISIERIGTGGDPVQARRLFAGLDGHVEALSVGGIDLYVRVGEREYPVRAALKLVADVRQTPVVDGRVLKYTLERRVFELAEPALGEIPHFRRAIIPFGTDRIGLIQAVSAVADRVEIGDLFFMLGLPIIVTGLDRFITLLRILMPIMSFLPMSMLYPPGTQGEKHQPKGEKYWNAADLIAGDMHYIAKYAPSDLSGKVVVTNTTTDANLETLRARGVKTVVTTSPRFEGRSFGINAMEAALTAYAGFGRQLTMAELDGLIGEIGLRPSVIRL
ncbi:MAG: hypothetical protein JXA42_14895 [Anaerolineales bacterium]|nr:hypothetical protein [Anaerolineales bacterium]